MPNDLDSLSFFWDIRGGQISSDPSQHRSSSPSSQSASSNVQTSRGTMMDARLQRDGKPKHSPVIYQYFGSKRKAHNHHQSSPSSSSSSSSSTSSPINSAGETIHFIILGRRVERFKNVGKMLASRGFDTMVCERVQQQAHQQHQQLQQSSQSQSQTRGGIWGTSTKNAHDAPDLVLEILDALKWKKVVLVGCDDECVLAMETAMMLAPDQVVGLILCGDVSEANRSAIEWGGIEIDSFLHRVLDCPFVIVWDGRESSLPAMAGGGIEGSTTSIDMSERALILGGGDAPYQSKPEIFAWVLTRFVEEKLEFVPVRPVIASAESNIGNLNLNGSGGGIGSNGGGGKGGILQHLNLPFGINSLVSPEGRLLLGRAVAAALFYTSVMKVFLVQYGVLRSGVISIKNSVDSVDALRRNVFQAIGMFIVNFGYIPRLFRVRVRKAKEVDENDLEPNGPEDIEEESDIETADDGQSSKSGASDEIDEDEESPSDEGSSKSPALSDEYHDDRSDEEQYDGGDKRSNDDESDRPVFKPFFFLDNVIT